KPPPKPNIDGIDRSPSCSTCSEVFVPFMGLPRGWSESRPIAALCRRLVLAAGQFGAWRWRRAK
ncbi:MAG TPA: hypothetical protein VLM40_14360, partial [Gemmata sp.]|nr:hypothetical protein [Gemmata sp.]